jgi:hypothetical protein
LWSAHPHNGDRRRRTAGGERENGGASFRHWAPRKRPEGCLVKFRPSVLLPIPRALIPRYYQPLGKENSDGRRSEESCLGFFWRVFSIVTRARFVQIVSLIEAIVSARESSTCRTLQP